MAIKHAILGTGSISNKNVNIGHSSETDFEFQVQSGDTTNPYSGIVTGSRIFVYGRQGTDLQGEVVAEGFVVQNGYVSALNQWVLVIKFTAADAREIYANYPNGDDRGFNASWHEGIQVADGETWTLQHVITGSNDHSSVRAAIKVINGTATELFHTTMKSGDPGLGTDGTDFITSISRIQPDGPHVLLTYDDGKS